MSKAAKKPTSTIATVPMPKPPKRLTHEEQERADIRRENRRILIGLTCLAVVIAAALYGWHFHETHPSFRLFKAKHGMANTISTEARTTPAQVDNTTITSGPYVGWTRYHNKAYGFSINAPTEVKISDYAPSSESDPPAASFLMDMYSDDSGRTIEFLHLAVYQTDLQASMDYQDTARSDVYQVAPTKQNLTIAGHKAVLYHYESDIRAVIYLIDNGQHTFAISGFIHTKDPESVTNYWQGFANTLASFSIDPQTSN